MMTYAKQMIVRNELYVGGVIDRNWWKAQDEERENSRNLAWQLGERFTEIGNIWKSSLGNGVE